MMVSKDELIAELEHIEDMIGTVIELWEKAVEAQDNIKVEDDDFVRRWKDINEEIDRLERLRDSFMDNHADIKERMLRIDRSNI